jgi:hypothetical protein
MENQMNKLLTVFVTLAALSHFSVQADDGKNYNGSSCINYSGGTIGYSYSDIYNSSTTSTMKNDCVAVKDTIAKGIKSAWIEVKDLSSTEDVSCRLVSHFNNVGSTGGSIWSSYKKTSGINSNWQKLTYGSLSAANNGHYYFSCSVPKRTGNGVSWLGTYSITENT